ncbi:nucleotidyltransferase family protein [Neobacillus niacini]|uniref:nucleotidyltransferase domain-containing protein n=1 Tax=Neobacillus niacini TaxID=86668 RepID=UPI002FFE4ACF
MNDNFNLDLEGLPKELKLILEIIKIENDQNLQLKKIEQISDVDWNHFLELAIHHRLYPLLYSKIKMIDQKILPKFVVQTIFQEYKKNTFQMLHLTAVMEEVSKEFAENEIRLLVLKGPVLAADLYGNLSLRTCRDLDILVSINNLEKVDKLLLRLGYKKDDYFQIENVLNDWRWRHHHISYFHPQKGVKLEIHWRLNPGPGKEPSFNEFWERKRISSLTTHPVYYLGREDLFFFLITHGARHGWSRLRWLVDVHEMVRQKMDWIKVLKLMREHQYLHLGGQVLILSSQLLETPISKEMKALILGKIPKDLAQKTIFYFEQMVNLHTEPLPESVSRYHDRYLLSLKTNRQKLLFYISVLYPSITDVKTIKLPKYLYVLYFPLRPFLLVMRKRWKQSLS